jgi:endonuclease-3
MQARNISNLTKTLVKNHNSKVPLDFSELIELPGVGRKTANVFLAEFGHDRIGVDTHVAWISREMGWTEHEKQELVEKDLEFLFPKRYWGRINWILVRFGQTHPRRQNKIRILREIKRKLSRDS